MTSGRVEVITSVERRRRWSLAEKQRLVAATLEPRRERFSGGARGRGASEPAVGLAATDAHCGDADQFCAGACAEGAPSSGACGGTIDLELSGARLRISGTVDPAVLTAVLAALAGGRR